MALSRVWHLGASPQVRGVIYWNKGPVLRPPTLVFVGVVRPLFQKSSYTSTMDALRIWKMLKWLGLQHCTIIKFRRRMKKFTYPWLAYSLPAAVILGMGDMIAQYHLKPHPPERTIGMFLRKGWAKGETLLFALMGFLLVGPILSKWNLYLYRKMRCQKTLNFLIRKLALDLLILSPILLTLMAAIYGFNYGQNIFKETKDIKKDKLWKHYFKAIKDSMTFNLMTRPAAALGIFFLAPLHLRRFLRSVYETIFSAYVSDTFRKNLRGKTIPPLPPPPPPPPPEKKREHSFPCTKEKKTEEPTESRWARYKKWACRNKEEV